MKSVFLVVHVHEIDGAEELKIIGIYSTKHDAQLAVRRKKRYVGFRDYPRGFHIARIELGKDQWSDGFIRS